LRFTFLNGQRAAAPIEFAARGFKRIARAALFGAQGAESFAFFGQFFFQCLDVVLELFAQMVTTQRVDFAFLRLPQLSRAFSGEQFAFRRNKYGACRQGEGDGLQTVGHKHVCEQPRSQRADFIGAGDFVKQGVFCGGGGVAIGGKQAHGTVIASG